MTTPEKIKQMITRISDVDISLVDSDTSLKKIGFDSLTFVELVMEAEKEFEIIIEDEDYKSLLTLDQWTKMIDSKI